LPFCDFFESDSAPESEDDDNLRDFELRLVTGVEVLDASESEDDDDNLRDFELRLVTGVEVLNAEPAVGDGVLTLLTSPFGKIRSS
jgi:hypothetical protein